MKQKPPIRRPRLGVFVFILSCLESGRGKVFLRLLMISSSPLHVDDSYLDELDPREFIIIKRARVNNLKNLSVAIPRNKLVGDHRPLGSGKSSLAFDTLFAEGQRCM